MGIVKVVTPIEADTTALAEAKTLLAESQSKIKAEPIKPI